MGEACLNGEGGRGSNVSTCISTHVAGTETCSPVKQSCKPLLKQKVIGSLLLTCVELLPLVALQQRSRQVRLNDGEGLRFNGLNA